MTFLFFVFWFLHDKYSSIVTLHIYFNLNVNWTSTLLVKINMLLCGGADSHSEKCRKSLVMWGLLGAILARAGRFVPRARMAASFPNNCRHLWWMAQWFRLHRPSCTRMGLCMDKKGLWGGDRLRVLMPPCCFRPGVERIEVDMKQLQRRWRFGYSIVVWLL